MEKKPSSIEWLVDQFKEYDFSEEDGMYLIKIPSWLLAEKEEKAKAMHKEEVERFNKFLNDEQKLGIADLKTIERIQWYYNTYFNETFGETKK